MFTRDLDVGSCTCVCVCVNICVCTCVYVCVEQTTATTSCRTSRSTLIKLWRWRGASFSFPSQRKDMRVVVSWLTMMPPCSRASKHVAHPSLSRKRRPSCSDTTATMAGFPTTCHTTASVQSRRFPILTRPRRGLTFYFLSGLVL